MNDIKIITVELEQPERLDTYLSKQLGITRNAVQILIADDKVFIDGKKQKKNYLVENNAKIEVAYAEPKEIEVIPQNIPLEILFEDNDIIIVNKPQGMVVHPSKGHENDTLVNALMYHCGDNLSTINGVKRPGIVHRIDMDTSGLLVITKNDFAHEFMSKQFFHHIITREYIAIVHGNIKNDIQTIDAPIGRSEKDRLKKQVTLKNSKHAITHVKVLERATKFSLVSLKLETGRTHQIRVHLAYIGHPILGDTVYGTMQQPYKLNGQLLHARKLGFVHPRTNEYIEFETEVPQLFFEMQNKIFK